MILNIDALITKRTIGRSNRKRNKIDIISNSSSTSIEEAKKKVHDIIESGKNIRIKDIKKKKQDEQELP